MHFSPLFGYLHPRETRKRNPEVVVSPRKFGYSDGEIKRARFLNLFRFLSIFLPVPFFS